MAEKTVKKREGFASKFGVIAAAAGSAIGLGNIWRFPYITGQNGGAAFILVYLIMVIFVGIPAMLAEMTIGRRSRRNPVGAFKKLKPNSLWYWVGIMGVFTGFLILAFYSTVAGWTLHYTYLSIINSFCCKTTEGIKALFENFHTSTFMPIFWQVIFMFLTGWIVIAGIQKGIERYTKLLMPLLFLILIILDIRAVTLHGAKQGLEFLFKFNFSKITGKVILEAMGQAFFSLSLGMGVLITYGSYIQEDNNLSNVAYQVAFYDTLVAILAGIAIFPAVFAFGLKPQSGPGLVFLTLPNIFQQMPGGYFFAILFFLLLVVAALTSSISLLEVVVAFATEELGLTRKKATIWATILITILGILATLSFGLLKHVTLFNNTFFDLLNNLTSDYLLPIGGFFIVIFVGWFMGKQNVYDELSNHGTLKARLFNVYMIFVRYIVPLAILLVFLYKSKII